MQQGFRKTETLREGVIRLSGDAALCDEASINPALYFHREFTHTLQDNERSFWNRHLSKPIRYELQLHITHSGRHTDPWWIWWEQAASFLQIFLRDQAPKESKLPFSHAAPSLPKLSLRVCMRPKCMSDVLHRSWICSLDVRSTRLLFGFEGSFAMIEAQIFLFLHREHHGFIVSYLVLHKLVLAPSDVELIDRLI